MPVHWRVLSALGDIISAVVGEYHDICVRYHQCIGVFHKSTDTHQCTHNIAHTDHETRPPNVLHTPYTGCISCRTGDWRNCANYNLFI